MKHARLSSLILSLLIAGAMVTLYAVAREKPLFEAVEGQTLDWRFQARGPVQPGQDVVILAIDDRTISTVGEWPLPRNVLAQAVRRLHSDGASVIAFDLLFLEPRRGSGSEEASSNDYKLTQALRAAGKVIVPFAFVFDTPQAGQPLETHAMADSGYVSFKLPNGEQAPKMPVPSALLAPIEPLRHSANLAHVNVFLAPDGRLRTLYPALGFADTYFPALPLEAARLFRNLQKGSIGVTFGEGLQFGSQWFPTDAQTRFSLNYYGAEKTFQHYAFIDLLEGRLAAGAFKDRIVLIGATALGGGDRFASPYTEVLSGVESFATATANFLDGRFLQRSRLTAEFDLLAIFAACLVVSAVWQLNSPWLATATTVLLLAAWAILVQLVFTRANLWLNVTFPAAAIMCCATVLAIRRTVLERTFRRRSERQREQLARFHSPLIVEQLAQQGPAAFEERHQPTAVLFADIEGYTGLSETLEPARVVRLLREFHRRVERRVLAHHGVIDKFIGDAVMVLFGLPEPTPDDAAQALACARNLVADIETWNKQTVQEGGVGVSIGIGLHYGPTLIATVGGERQQQLTATGDTVNIASRLEELTRTYQTTVVASEALVAQVNAVSRTDLLAGLEPLGPKQIRGRRERVAVWGWSFNGKNSQDPIKYIENR